MSEFAGMNQPVWTNGRPVRRVSGIILFRLRERGLVKTTTNFDAMYNRPDRAAIKLDSIRQVIHSPLREHIQSEGRIRRWASIPQAGGRFPRVVPLPDGETVHNAFFDWSFNP